MQEEVRLLGLDRLEFLDLQKELGTGVVEEPAPLSDSEYHELVSTIALLTLTPGKIALLAAWLAKNLKLDVEFETTNSDGTRRKMRLRFSSEEAKDKKGLTEKIKERLTKYIFGDDKRS